MTGGSTPSGSKQLAMIWTSINRRKSAAVALTLRLSSAPGYKCAAGGPHSSIQWQQTELGGAPILLLRHLLQLFLGHPEVLQRRLRCVSSSIFWVCPVVSSQLGGRRSGGSTPSSLQIQLLPLSLRVNTVRETQITQSSWS